MRHLAVLKRILRWALVSLVFLLAGTGKAAEFRHPAEYDGTLWKAMSEEEKMAYLAGFLAGITLEQVLSSGAQDQEVRERIMALRAEGRLHFPFAPHVYKARLEDYYFYQDHLQKTIPEALLEINRHLRPRP